MTFQRRDPDLPQLISASDGTELGTIDVPGPFCRWCGNPLHLHRETDLACPKEHLSPLFPSGERDRHGT